MKKLILTIAAAVTLGMFSAQAQSNVDLSKSKIEWEGKKVGGGHNGTIDLKSGTLKVNDGEITGGTFVIDMNSIVCLDIENADYNAKLVGHLKNDDFFSVDKFPTAELVITKVVKLKGNEKGLTHNIYGNLTIKGITHEVVFPAKIATDANGTLVATASFPVDRSKYDVKYGSTTFFPNLADKAISNDMNFKVTLVAR